MSTMSIGGSHWLRRDAAQSYLRMRQAGCPAPITSSTRTEALQWDYYRNQGRPGWPALADHPARSKHVWRPNDTADTGARALDLPEPARAWVVAHGARYGWIRTILPREPWHFEYHASRDIVLVTDPGTGTGAPDITVPDGSLPAPLTPRRRKMLMLIRQNDQPEVWLTDLMTRRHIPTEHQLGIIQRRLTRWGMDSDVVEVTDATVYGPVIPTIPTLTQIARALWGYRMSGTGSVPAETAGERLRRIRLSTN